MAAVAFALASSVAFGAADFIGGLLSRRFAVVAVVLVSQVSGLAAALLVAFAVGGPLAGRSLALGALAGLFAGTGLVAYYRALSVGTMSVVAPIAACGAVVPLSLALVAGERPSSLRLAGAVVAVSGAALTSVQERRAGEAGREAVALALATAVLLGLLLYVFAVASRAGSVAAAMVGVRAGSLAVAALWAVALARAFSLPRRWALVAVLLVGALAAAANGVYGLASARGPISIVALLASLYPVTTVLLAHTVLGERLTRIQVGGVSIAFVGVGMTTAAA
jgi:drug/metabolite transporter (DMT)-like permease